MTTLLLHETLRLADPISRLGRGSLQPPLKKASQELSLDGQVLHSDENTQELLRVSNLRSLSAVSTLFSWAMYTYENGLAMWSPSNTNVGDIGYFEGGGFIELQTSIFDSPFGLEQPTRMYCHEVLHEWGGIRCSPPSISDSTRTVISPQRCEFLTTYTIMRLTHEFIDAPSRSVVMIISSQRWLSIPLIQSSWCDGRRDISPPSLSRKSFDLIFPTGLSGGYLIACSRVAPPAYLFLSKCIKSHTGPRPFSTIILNQSNQRWRYSPLLKTTLTPSSSGPSNGPTLVEMHSVGMRLPAAVLPERYRRKPYFYAGSISSNGHLWFLRAAVH